MKKPKRTRIVAVRMTEAEYEAIQARAKKRNRSVSSLLRDACYERFAWPAATTTAATNYTVTGAGYSGTLIDSWTYV